jgi:tRNA(Ile)-lysidine synthase
MGNSRKPSSSELPERVAAALAPAIAPGAHLVAALSGGMDSMALLSALAELSTRLRFSLRALHVNHGISPNASRWAGFCVAQCGRLGVPLQTEAVDISPYRALGLEAAARMARYEAFARVDADFVVLAQHRDDQAETLLLRLLRGAGVRGLSGMAPLRAHAGARAKLARPLLDVPRAEIEAYARDRGLEWIEDESNADTARARNFLRHEVLPLMERQFPAARAAMARAAANLGEARELVDAMAQADLAACGDGEFVAVPALLALGETRAKNALRCWCDTRGIVPLSSARLGELLRQLRESRVDARTSLVAGKWELQRYRDRLHLKPAAPAPWSDLNEEWNGENALPLLALGGVLKFKPEEGRGLSVERLRSDLVTVRLRKGGERLRLDLRRPRRTLKNLFQERGVPPWRRDRLPLVYCGERLVSVPGVGDACEFRAGPGEAGLIVTWEPLA